ncbi:hypothetical protein RHMOL_Rhmol01G0083700 [Rhododendron molle]|uniref:Uncharacterized protein n=1 Tax=Rhododendron molle TaxID=49168 RepID=A0ACC0Q166_RHOML|nr:hypothetical protein RHMOL_Rhmol01G0083700 [Rhododendron molle]
MSDFRRQPSQNFVPPIPTVPHEYFLGNFMCLLAYCPPTPRIYLDFPRLLNHVLWDFISTILCFSFAYSKLCSSLFSCLLLFCGKFCILVDWKMKSMRLFALPIIGFFVMVFFQISCGQGLAPSPAPSAPTSDGTAIDQGVAYVLLLVALAITYLVH